MIILLVGQVALAQGPCIPTDIADLTQRAKNLLLDGDYAGALETIQQAEDSIPCASSHLWPYQISMLYQTRAAVAARTEGGDAARGWYTHAVRMAPPVSFDATLYRAGREHFSAVRAAEEQAPRVQVSAPAGAILDGVFIPPGSDRGVSPGTHIVQYLTADGSLLTEVVVLDGDAQIGPAAEPLAELPPEVPAGGPRPAVLASGAGLVIVGGVLLGSGAYWQRRAGEYTVAGIDEADAISRTANLLTATGAGALTVGSGVLVGGLWLTDGPAISFTVTR